MTAPDPYSPEGRAELLRQVAADEVRRAAAIEALPCTPSRKRGDAAGARLACGDLHRTCGEVSDYGREQETICIHVEDHQRFRPMGRKLAAAPPRVRETVERSLRGFSIENDLREKRPADLVLLVDTNSLRLVKAWTTRAPATVDLVGGGSVQFRGTEEVLLLAGGVGIGKSIAAGWALAHCGEDGARWISARVLADLPAHEGEPDAFAKALTASFLVVDDLGVEHVGATGWAVSRAQELLERRHEARSRTVITCNLARREFAGRYGRRVDDRLNESGIYVTLGDASLRGAR